MFEFILACLPFFSLILFLLIFKWSTLKSIGTSLVVTILVIVYWGITKSAAVEAIIQSLSIFLEIIAIVAGAIFLLELMKGSGGINSLKESIRGITKDKVLIAILIGVGMVAIIEGVAGFGTPAALAAPILASIGIAPMNAVMVSLIGDTFPVTYGAMGTPLIYGIGSLYPNLIENISQYSALILGIIGAIIPTMIVLFMRKKVKKYFGFSISVGLITGLALYLSSFLSIELPAIIAGLALILSAIMYIGLSRRTIKIQLKPFIPYILIIILLIITRTERLKPLLQEISFTIGPHTFTPLYHPLIIFLIVSLITIVLFKIGKSQTKEASQSMLMKVRAVAVPLLLILLLVQLLQYSEVNTTGLLGIPQTIAETISTISNPPMYILLAPFIGTIGAFMAGSNTVSNLLFSTIQHSAAVNLGINPALILALQTSGGAIGNMIALHNIIAATAILGIYNKEGEIFRKLAKYAMFLGLIAGVIGLIFYLVC